MTAKLALVGQPWEQLPKESLQAYHAFTHYRDLPIADRSITHAHQEHARACQKRTGSVPMNGRWKRWSMDHRWVERTSDYARHLDQAKTGAELAEVVEVGRRHAEVAMAALDALYQPVLTVAKVLQSNPEVLEQLARDAGEDPAAFIKLLDITRNVAAVMPTVAKMEREARGLEEGDRQEHVVRVVLELDEEFRL